MYPYYDQFTKVHQFLFHTNIKIIKHLGGTLCNHSARKQLAPQKTYNKLVSNFSIFTIAPSECDN